MSRNPFHALENEADWEILSGKQVTAAEKILKDADGFLIMVESVLQASCERIQNSVCGSNAAFEARLIGLRRVKDQLEEEHAQVRGHGVSYFKRMQRNFVETKRHKKFLKPIKMNWRLQIFFSNSLKNTNFNHFLSQISINIRNMEDTLDKLRKGVVEKQAAIALAESRLQLRRQRPNYELVK